MEGLGKPEGKVTMRSAGEQMKTPSEPFRSGRFTKEIKDCMGIAWSPWGRDEKGNWKAKGAGEELHLQTLKEQLRAFPSLI